jgi:hypothetical protein
MRHDRPDADDNNTESAPSEGTDRETREQSGGESPQPLSSPHSEIDGSVAGESEIEQSDDLGADNASALQSTSGSLADAPADFERAVEAPPPAPALSTADFVAHSFLSWPAETGGVSFAGLSSDASAFSAGGADEIGDLIDRMHAASPGEVPEPFLSHVEPASPPPGESFSPEGGERAPVTTRQLPPLVIGTPGNPNKVQKRLEIQVEVTVTNGQRISQIAGKASQYEFRAAARDAVFPVRRDLRQFRESFRNEFGR